MKNISWWKLFWAYMIVLFTLEIIVVTFFSLSSGIVEMFPYLYILPIILLARLHPRFAIYFTIVLGWIYLGLVYFYGPHDIRLFATSVAWFYIFVTIGVIVSSMADSLKQDKIFREIFTNSQAGIFTFDPETGRIKEINKRAAHMLGYEPDELRNTLISKIWYDDREREGFISRLKSEHQITDTEVVFSKKDEKSLWALFTASIGTESLVICSALDITERKRMKDVIDESEIRYRTLFDSASDAIFIHDLDGRIFEANQIACDRLGYTREEIVTLNLKDLDVSAYTRMQDILIKNIHEPVTTIFETVHRSKDGHQTPNEVSSRTIQYRSGVAIISIYRDISERQKAEAALRESEKRYRTLIDKVPDYIIVHNNGEFLYVNPATAAVLGYTVDELVHTHISRYIAPRYREIIKQAMANRSTGEYLVPYEAAILKKDGSERLVEIRGAMITFDGQPASLNVLTDITERKEVDLALRESEKRYRMVGELIPYGVWMCDAQGRFTFLSDSFLDLIGLTLPECSAFGWVQRLPPVDRERTISDWKQCVQTGCIWDYEYRIIDRDGKEHFILSRGSPLYDERERVISWVGIHLDITERRRYENRLEASLREKEVIIKEVHHRVKNNMQVISGFLQLQSNYISDPVAIEKLNESQRRVKTMALVHEKLYQSKSLEFINTAEYIKSLVSDLMDSYAIHTAVDVQVNVDNVSVNLDTAIPCGLIINELMTNCLKYAFKGRTTGNISLDLHLGADHMFTLIVADDGAGLPSDYDVRSTATLGTQLVNVLVRQLGGEMKVTVENGARFEIVFPEKF
ncbi:MAG: PAS domain S-box protein [Methanoregula sp.]|nr:PAS domain S-box protein [Methanoregula sp.]